MVDIQVIRDALRLLEDLQGQFETTAPNSYDDRRMRELLDEVLAVVRKSKTADNTVLIALERFHKSFSVSVGLGAAELTQPAKKAWRAYDAFHMDQVQGNLHFYGIGIGI
ncbi:hypothetical protein ABID29_002393 [Streptococcus rupicaprae]|uniref:Helicase BlpT n=1 Tax=Streptococcus rupicaprae TaxID=759619 RepID=A0ABV2FL70_9STRE